ncbi:peptidase, T1 family [Cooperia oncophora]
MAGGMHFLIGIATNDYVILASDKATFAYGAVLADSENDKEYRLGKKMTMMCIGEEGDVDQFGDWAKRNIRLYAIRNGYELCPRSAHHWIRRGIAEALRTEDYYAVDVLLGGYDDKEGKAFLGSVDYLGNGLDDQVDMTEEEGLSLLNKCIAEAKRRFVANLPGYKVVVIDKKGYRQLPDIKV